MREIEAKFLEIDSESVIARLNAIGAKKTFEGDIEAIYFDAKGRALRKAGIVLRLRKRGDSAELTLKKRIGVANAKIMEEMESEVSDFREMRNILHGLGFREIVKRKKRRTSYRLDGVNFEIDRIEGIPAYLEIEAPSVERIGEAAKLLGLDMKDSKPWAEGEVRKHYAKK